MSIERVLWGSGVAMALVLLFGVMSPRTSWQHESGGGMRHSAGWDWFATFSGVVAAVRPVIGRASRPTVIASTIAALIAALVFGASTAASLGHWLDLMSGGLNISRWIIRPAPGVAWFAAFAGIGMAASLVLTGLWLRTADFGASSSPR